MSQQQRKQGGQHPQQNERDESLYETLHVDRGANTEEISKAYRVLAAELHPDKGGDPERFKKVNEAYRILATPETRRIYDSEGLVGINRSPDVQFARGFSSSTRATFASTAASAASSTMNRLQQRVIDSQTVDYPLPEGARGPESFEQWMQRTNTMTPGNAPRVYDVTSLIEREVVPVVNYDVINLPVVPDVPCVSFEMDRWYPQETPTEKLVVLERQTLPQTLDFLNVAVSWTLVPINPADLLELRGVGSDSISMSNSNASSSSSSLQGQSNDGGRPRTKIAGNEGIGIVRKVGSGVKNLVEGDLVIPKVLGLGTWRPLGIYRESQLLKLPKDFGTLELHQLASLKELVAAYRLLEDYVELSPGDTVLQTAANGTVGQTIIQMCRTLRINTVNIIRMHGTTPQQQQLDNSIKERLKELGGTVVIDTSEPLWPAIRDARVSEPRLLLDCIGGNLTTIAGAAADSASLVIYGGLSLKPHVVPTGKYLYNDLRVRGFSLQKLMQKESNNNASNESNAFTNAAQQVAVLLKAHRLDVDADIRVFDPQQKEITPRQFWAKAVTDAVNPGKLKKIFVSMPDFWTPYIGTAQPTPKVPQTMTPPTNLHELD